MAFDTRKALDGLLQKPMNRKSFIKHMGIGALAVTGVNGALKSLSGDDLNGAATGQTGRAYAGYGASAYGK